MAQRFVVGVAKQHHIRPAVRRVFGDPLVPGFYPEQMPVGVKEQHAAKGCQPLCRVIGTNIAVAAHPVDGVIWRSAVCGNGLVQVIQAVPQKEQGIGRFVFQQPAQRGHTPVYIADNQHFHGLLGHIIRSLLRGRPHLWPRSVLCKYRPC